MPIKDASRYPKNWREISDRIRFVRAKGRCECRGECGLHHGRRCEERHGQKAKWAKGKVVLTVHHRDFNPANSEDESNLAALCQRCHCRLDIPLHQAHARATRLAKRREALRMAGQGELWGEG